MRSLLLVALAAMLFSACDGGEPLPAEPETTAATSSVTSPTPVVDPVAQIACTIPDGYTLVIHQCSPTSTISTCVAQNYPFAYVPPADLPNVTQLPIADCAVTGRADLKCVSACP